MIVTCNECGKKYRIDTEKIKGEEASFRCRDCNCLITAVKTAGAHTETLVPPPARSPSSSGPENSINKKVTEDALPSPSPKTGGMGLGLTSKFMLSIFLPLLVIYGLSVFFSMENMTAMHKVTVEECKNAVIKLGKYYVRDQARSVALQVKQYLSSHPSMTKEYFDRDNDFKKVAVRKVGRTGYTFLYELPSGDGVWRTWAHVNPKIIAKDMKTLEKSIGMNFSGFWNIYTDVENGVESQGFYKWNDADGVLRDKFMFCSPVEGTPYVVAATADIGELTQPVKKIGEKTNQISQETRKTNAMRMGAGLLLIALIIFLVGHNLTGKIKSLSDTANRICGGELDAEIKVKSRDEVGKLADAISLMRDRIRVAVKETRDKATDEGQ